jgi:hypothetical protein
VRIYFIGQGREEPVLLCFFVFLFVFIFISYYLIRNFIGFLFGCNEWQIVALIIFFSSGAEMGFLLSGLKTCNYVGYFLFMLLSIIP